MHPQIFKNKFNTGWCRIQTVTLKQQLINDKSSGQMTEIFLTEFISAKKKIEGSALYEDELLDNSYLCKLNASNTILIEK